MRPLVNEIMHLGFLSSDKMELVGSWEGQIFNMNQSYNYVDQPSWLQFIMWLI